MTEFFPFNFDKALMTKNEWKNLKCEKCGGKLELEKANDFEEVKTCKDCDCKTLFIKKLRKDWNDRK